MRLSWTTRMITSTGCLGERPDVQRRPGVVDHARQPPGGASGGKERLDPAGVGDVSAHRHARHAEPFDRSDGRRRAASSSLA